MLLLRNSHQPSLLFIQKSRSDIVGASERISLARALHDGIAQDLVALRFRIEYLAGAPNLPIHATQELRRISLEISSLTEKVRDELYDLHRPSSLTLEQELRALIEIHSKEILFKLSFSFGATSTQLAQVILSMTVELIRNTLTHARATLIELSIVQLEESIQYSFSDNGLGGAHESAGRFGLSGVRESVELLGGDFQIRDEGGTQICALFPIQES